MNAIAGIMITASHNPKDDNGYKVYWSNGCQIIPPHDSLISKSILENLEPITWDLNFYQHHVNCIIPTDILSEYYTLLSKQSKFHLSNQVQNVKFCYTPMHGVGYEFAKEAFKCFSLNNFYPVPLQNTPDPNFPTVIFPNPEEKGALDLAIEYASINDCKVILANDPDADRFAAAEYFNSKWNIFTGNQIGILLASFILNNSKQGSAVLTTTVSSHMLQEMAKSHNIEFHETLTGFKWLGNKAYDLELRDIETVFAYEEALGYMCNNQIKDKDGISALAIFAEWTNHLYSLGKSLVEYLDELYQKYGYWVTNNSYYCNNRLTWSAMTNKPYRKYLIRLDIIKIIN
jgi:phosphomannomutase